MTTILFRRTGKPGAGPAVAQAAGPRLQRRLGPGAEIAAPADRGDISAHAFQYRQLQPRCAAPVSRCSVSNPQLVTAMKRLFTPLLLLVVLSGCAGRLNPNCDWTNDPALPLDLRKPADERHLTTDAMIAEELAIRFADTRRGHRSGHFAGMDEYVQTREQCMATLFAVVA